MQGRGRLGRTDNCASARYGETGPSVSAALIGLDAKKALDR